MLRQLAAGEPVDVLSLLFAEERRSVGRPYVMLNIVESIDGATAVDGSATPLNDRDDRDLFLALRAVADFVMNGAATVRAENLGPPRMSDEMAIRRAAAGMSPHPTMVILTRALDLDPAHRIFSDPEKRPTVICGVEADPERVELVGRVADVIQVDPLSGMEIVQALGDSGVILCEGGPTINSELIRDDVVDEVNLTVSPLLALGESKRVASGPSPDSPVKMRLDRTLVGDRSLFLRFVRG